MFVAVFSNQFHFYCQIIFVFFRNNNAQVNGRIADAIHILLTHTGVRPYIHSWTPRGFHFFFCFVFVVRFNFMHYFVSYINEGSIKWKVLCKNIIHTFMTLVGWVCFHFDGIKSSLMFGVAFVFSMLLLLLLLVQVKLANRTGATVAVCHWCLCCGFPLGLLLRVLVFGSYVYIARAHQCTQPTLCADTWTHV